jgi:hypothetical protein
VKVTEAFRDAETLAVFANLDPANLSPLDSKNVANFRNNYPDFAPSEWWDYLYRIDGNRVLRYEDVIKIDKSDPNYESKIASKIVKQWQHTQNEIQKAWQAGFKLNASEVSDLLKLVFCVHSPGLAWNSSQVLLPNGAVYELRSKLYSFHKAVLYLLQNPRQAKRCKKCRKYFVHVRGKREFCEYPDSRGETCRYKNDNKRRLDYYYATGKRKRQAKTRKGSPRLPGSRLKKTAAKT